MSGQSSRLVLLGTIHRDPDGAAKLTRALDESSPDIITVETSPYAVQFRQQHGRRLRAELDQHIDALARELGSSRGTLSDHPALALLRATLELPYEYAASQAWAEAHAVRCLPIDDSERSRRLLDVLEAECLTVDNLRALVTDPDSTSVAERVVEQELLARGYLREPGLFPYHYSDDERADIAKRDRRMTEQIRALLGESDDRCLVHVCGWEHMVQCDAIETIAQQLRDLSPARRLIR